MLALVQFAAAAAVTEIPPFLRGDVTIGYAADQLTGHLAERTADGDVQLAARSLTDHRLHYGVAFGAGPGVAVFLDVPHYAASTVAYSERTAMVFEPATGSGTYAGTNPADDGVLVSGAGLGGVWFGVRGTPFSEAFPRRQSRVTWLLEGALRPADPTSVWTAQDGNRGAGTGGFAARIHTAFSKRSGTAETYVAGTYTHEGARELDTVDYDDATTLARKVEIDPPDAAKIRIGVEAELASNAASGGRSSFDIHFDGNYSSWGTIASGVYLPDPLDNTRGRAVQTSESYELGTGVAFRLRPMQYFDVALFGDIAYRLPQRVESPYPVYTGADTVHWVAGTDLTFRIR